MFGSFGPTEILLIFLIVLLVFGAKRIPEIAQGLGKGIREFRKAAHEVQNEISVQDTQESRDKEISVQDTQENKDADDNKELAG